MIMKSELTDQQYKEALERGRAALSEPYAVEARFNSKTKLLAVTYSNKTVFVLDVRHNEILAPYADKDLANPYVTPGGDGILFDKADLEFSLPSIIACGIPSSLARKRMAMVMGSARSEKKAIAARANGSKGGRPKKELAAA